MSRTSRRFRRSLVLLNLMLAAYLLASVWLLHVMIDPSAQWLPSAARSAQAGKHVLVVTPFLAITTLVAFALLRWPPPRAPIGMLRIGLGLQLASWVAIGIGASRYTELAIATVYAILAVRLAARTFLKGEPREVDA